MTARKLEEAIEADGVALVSFQDGRLQRLAIAE